MDPVTVSPPEIILNGREEPDDSHSRYLHFSHSPYYHQPFSAHEMLHRIANSEQTHTLTWTQMDSNTNQQFPQHLTPSLIMGPTQAHESPFGLNLLPGVCPSPLHLPVLSPGTRVHREFKPVLPELILTPCSPRDSCWLDMSPASSTPNTRCSFSPYMFVPRSPFLPPHSLLVLPEVHPSWCMCPRVVQVELICSPEL